MLHKACLVGCVEQIVTCCTRRAWWAVPCSSFATVRVRLHMCVEHSSRVVVCVRVCVAFFVAVAGMFFFSSWAMWNGSVWCRVSSFEHGRVGLVVPTSYLPLFLFPRPPVACVVLVTAQEMNCNNGALIRTIVPSRLEAPRTVPSAFPVIPTGSATPALTPVRAASCLMQG